MAIHEVRNVPNDVPKLLSAGAAAVFPTGTSLEELVQQVRKLTSEKVD